MVEETGHRVRVREFLGAITYRARGRPKVVQFWHMQAAARPSYDLMRDIAAVDWLPLKAAIRRLSYPLEKLFLGSVGRRAMHHRKKAARRKTRKAKSLAKSSPHKTRAKTPRPAKRRRSRKPAAKPVAKVVTKTRSAKTRVHKIRSAAAATAARAERGSMLQRMLGTLGR